MPPRRLWRRGLGGPRGDPPALCPPRSPSPEPIYNSEGKRLNTREFRTRKKLEEERHNLITEMVALNPDFKPPADYKWVPPRPPQALGVVRGGLGRWALTAFSAGPRPRASATK